MSQFADGGLMATKPYISGSNNLMNMSDFTKGEMNSGKQKAHLKIDITDNDSISE